jgi:hypothetical protein
VTDFVDGLLDRVTQETKYSIYINLLNGIKELLINKFLFKDLSMSKVCMSLCAAYKSRSKFIMSEENLEKVQGKTLSYTACSLWIRMHVQCLSISSDYCLDSKTIMQRILVLAL